ncbi:MAG: outer membrane beta-barrel protein [Candidatus Binatus sp.]|uniref:outer membrane beta-barrel protein n=1 Tax=Candidatus Binatus sp. TaxID=2811406 RepID=UPI0027274CE0|nr:outer membrane beta-barrel protein [Candidatus Binatus sp.]MDO8433379.1 outer membrane beta-barrel protein [Candidatus Binatus sp.]
MNRRRTARAATRTSLIAGVALISMLCNASAWAETTKKHKRTSVTTTTSTVVASTSEQQRLNALAGQMTNLQKQSDDTVSEVKKIEQAITVAPPAQADAKPQTVGEHVGVLEKSFGDLKTDLANNLGIHVHGLVDAGYEHNFNQPNHNTNVIRVFDQDGFQLTQGNIHIDRTVEGGVGFVTDLNFGQVANTLSFATRYSNAFPVGNQWFDPTQLYLTYTAPIGSGINFSAGRFVTLLGAETINTYNNLNFNESKGIIFGFGIPFTHTGVRGAYTFNDYVSFIGGVNNGWDDPAAFNNGGPNYEGELALNNKEKTVSLLINGIWGPNLVGKSNSNLGAIDPVATWKPWFLPKLTLQSEYVYGTQSGPVINGHSGSWTGVSGYVVYDWTDQFETATRGEMFQDKDGSRTGTAQTLWEVTQTLSYKIPQVTGLLGRLEYRHDNSSQNVFTNNNFVDPVTGVQHLWRGQDTVSANMIYAF